MNCLMAARGKASAAAEPPRVLLTTDEDLPPGGLLLEMALEAQDRIALDEHPRVDRSVRLMAGRAAFAHRLMLEDEGPALRDVALATGILLGGKRRPAADNHLALVRIMAVGATDLALRHRVMIGKLKAPG